MTVIEFSTVVGCCVNCHWCPQTKIEAAYSGPRLMTLDTFRRCLSHLPAGVPLVFAGFAEPYLNRHTTDMIELAAGEHEIQVYTTAVGMVDADVAGLAKFQPKSITLHLADAEGYATIRVDEAYVDRIAALSALPNVNVMTMGTLHPVLVPLFGNLKPLPMHSRAGNVAGMVQISKSGPLKCGAAEELDHPIVLPSGEMVACCNCYSMEHRMGNLADRSWESLRAGPELAEMRRLMSEGGDTLCRTCEMAEPMESR